MLNLKMTNSPFDQVVLAWINFLIAFMRQHLLILMHATHPDCARLDVRVGIHRPDLVQGGIQRPTPIITAPSHDYIIAAAETLVSVGAFNADIDTVIPSTTRHVTGAVSGTLFFFGILKTGIGWQA